MNLGEWPSAQTQSNVLSMGLGRSGGINAGTSSETLVPGPPSMQSRRRHFSSKICRSSTSYSANPSPFTARI
eukprot:9479938-Pyramimonas_sp.AAC.1